MNDCDGLARMALHRVEAPALPVLTLEEARMQLRVTPMFGTSPPSHPEDALIADCVQAATDELEGVTGWLGRSLVQQTWRLSLPAFPSGPIMLPLPPLQSVTSVTYLDKDGVRQTLGDTGASPAGEDYSVVTDAEVGYVAPAFGKSWPSGRRQGDAVQITFVAGYASPAAVPAVVRRWIAGRLGFYYENREAMITGTIATMLPPFDRSLDNLRVRGVYQP